jgi:CHAT domain-containing protein
MIGGLACLIALVSTQQVRAFTFLQGRSPNSSIFWAQQTPGSPPEVPQRIIQQLLQQVEAGEHEAAAALFSDLIDQHHIELGDREAAIALVHQTLMEATQTRAIQYHGATSLALQQTLDYVQLAARTPEEAIASLNHAIPYLLDEVLAFSLSPEALAQARQIFAQAQAEPDPERALALLNGQLIDLIATQDDSALAQARLAEGRRFFETMLALYEISLGTDHPFTQAQRMTLLYWYSSTGDIFRAERVAEAPGSEWGESEEAVSGQAWFRLLIYQQTGRLSEAEAWLKGELSRETDPVQQADLLRWLGLMQHSQGNYPAAIPPLEEALERLADLWQIDPDPNQNLGALVSYLYLLSDLAGVYVTLGNYSQAEALLAQTQALQAQIPETLSPVWGATQADLYRRQGKYEEAEALWRSLGDHESVLNALAELFWAKGDLTQAVQVRQQALVAEERRISAALSAASDDQSQRLLNQFSLQQALSATISFSLQESGYEPAANLGLTNVLQRKGRSLDLLAARQAYLREHLDPGEQAQLAQLEQVRSQLAELMFQPLDGANVAQIEAQIAALQAEAEQLEADLLQRHAIAAENLSGVTAAAVQQQLPSQTVLVEYILYRPYDLNQPLAQALGAPRYAAYVLHPQGAAIALDLGNAATIDGLITEARQAMQRRATSRATIRDVSHRLYQTLIAPLPLADATHLLLAPDGQMNLLPFAALVDESDRYLVETYQLTTLTSGRDLLKFTDLPTVARPPILIANPDYNEAERTQTGAIAHRGWDGTRAPDLRDLKFSQLQGTAAEVEAIAPLLTQPQVLMGAAATETALKQVRSPQILHIATHGFFLEDVMPPAAIADLPPLNAAASDLPALERTTAATHPLLRSGLALAGFNPRQSDGEDGVLTALEAAGLNLQGTQLVVLSACETGVGDIATGEGVYGLRRAFVLAGAESQVTSLWKVDDQATKTLMVDYYEQLLQQSGRSEALRQTQLQMLQNPVYQHPYYWAAFVFSGDWSPLQ